MAAMTGGLCETCDLAVSLTPALNFLFHAKLYISNIAYLELRNGSAGNGTQAQASHLNTDPAANQNQQWQITASGIFTFLASVVGSNVFFALSVYRMAKVGQCLNCLTEVALMGELLWC